MKSLIIATAAITLAASSAFAQATIDSKPTTSNGSTVGRSSSSYTGNGDYIGGNGTSSVDQTTGPASRPNLMQSYGVMNGNANGLSNGNHGNGSHH
ncbi:hypothetical protein [Rhizobium grahamii]|uniref:DUF680 domain-containing protein n=1 Tax=Rhizobium grahamii TaxID=1120045 RepID=A0A370KSK8_9HYPH|nr:hypothetical protein [Rhizobium grahamii]RDJ13472.1 hypothetical protein B5K06_08765 [Rhizobium grahamii]